MIRDKLFEALHRQAQIVQQMAADPRLPPELQPVVVELAAAAHNFDVQKHCLNALKSHIHDHVSNYATTIVEADVYFEAMEAGF